MADWKDKNDGNWEELWKALNTPIWDEAPVRDEGCLNRKGKSSGVGETASGLSSTTSSRGSGSPSNSRNSNSAVADPSQDPNPSRYTSKEHRHAKKNRYKKRSEEKKHSEHSYGGTTKRIGFHTAEDCPLMGQANTHSSQGEKRIHKPGFFTLVFGVFLPLGALILEVNTHEMARSYFDPFPTFSHVFLFLLIPLSNFLSWLAVRLNISPLYSMMSLGSGMALGIAILYTLMFLPITPLFLLLTLAGVGFLGLAPLLSIPVTLLCGVTICQLADRHKTFFDAHQLKHLGHLIILVMVIAVELPSTLTRYELAQTDNFDLKARTQAIQWLRQWGSRDVLLRACYERSGEPTDILGSLAERQHSLSVDQARRIYYQVTGVSFNSVPIPSSFRGTIKHSGLIDDPAGLNEDVKDEFDLDPDIAGELVSGVARGLSVSDSSITGSLDSNNGVGILDWNFTFENVSTIPREARAKILLPPNAVVTRATLWLDDLERETTIQERGLARQTYQESVVSHKRDPLLVSMCGQDSVLVQCYPVMKGTKTKIRLHIVSPLVVANDKEESLVLPTFEERNFAITIPHKIVLKGKKAISIAGTDAKESEKGGLYEVNANLDNSLLSRFAAVPKIGSSLSGSSDEVLTIRPPESTAQVRQAFYSQLPDTEFRAHDFYNSPAGKDNSLTVVVDKSITMSAYINDVVSALKSAPKSLPITIVEVKDGVSTFCVANHSNDSGFQSAVTKLLESKCEGGQSDAAALDTVFERPEETRGAVLWIHAAQPVVPDLSSGYMRTSIERNGRAALYDLQVASGPNEVLPASYDFPGLSRVVRTASLSSDITSFLDNLANNKVRRCATTFGVRKESALPEVAQVQAYKLALSRYHSGDKFGAYELAQRYHLVTPVSSAVVTEEVPLVAKNEEAEKYKMRAKSGPILLDSISNAFALADKQLSELSSAASTSEQMKPISEMKEEFQSFKAPVSADADDSSSKLQGRMLQPIDPAGQTNMLRARPDRVAAQLPASEPVGSTSTKSIAVDERYSHAKEVSPTANFGYGNAQGLPPTTYGAVGGKFSSLSAAAPGSAGDNMYSDIAAERMPPRGEGLISSAGDNSYSDIAKDSLDRKAVEKTKFFNAPRHMQIINESPTVNNYRKADAAKKTAESGAISSIMLQRQAATEQSSMDRESRYFSGGGGGSNTPVLSGAVNGTIGPQSAAGGSEMGMAAAVPDSVQTAAVRQTDGFLDATGLLVGLGVFAFILILCLFKMCASREEFRKPEE